MDFTNYITSTLTFKDKVSVSLDLTNEFVDYLFLSL